jgi:hypothetical protein
MRLDDLIKELQEALENGETPPEYEVTVNLDGNEFTIERISPCSDGVVIMLET